MSKIASGIYPVMITPFTADNQVDYEAVDQMMEFYARGGCQGVFAVCQSSEMFCLTEEERVKLAARVVKAAAGRMCVVASGHISDRMADQIRELGRIAETGVDACVMVSNRLAAPDESDDVLIERMSAILNALPNVAFGMYECPYPYKRLLTPKVLEAMAETGRFTFIKDTCCDARMIRERIQVIRREAAVAGVEPLGLYNANTMTLLETLRDGASGFSGVMGNLHPELYVWLDQNWREQPEKAEELQALLTLLSSLEGQGYPICAKRHMEDVGVEMTLIARNQPAARFGYAQQETLRQAEIVEKVARRLCGIEEK